MITIAEAKIRAYAVRIADLLVRGHLESARAEYAKMIGLPFDSAYMRVCLNALPEGRKVLEWFAVERP